VNSLDQAQLKQGVASERGELKSKKLLLSKPVQQEVKTAGFDNDITISQQPFRDLPAARQQMQARDKRTIQTQYQQTDRGATLTLFPDSPFKDEDLRAARVQQVASDSIVVEVRSQRIGFKLPEQVLESQKAARRAKER